MTMNDSSFTNPFIGEPDTNSGTTESANVPVYQPHPAKPASFNMFSSIQTIATYAFLLATLFTLFSPNNLFSSEMLTRVFQAWQANPTLVAPVSTAGVNPSINHIGIVSGHWKNDSGSVCSNGLTEEQVNLTIASLVQQQLTAEGFQVDLLEEFDSRLSQYKAIALISIHNDTCEYISDAATGFKVAAAPHSAYPEKATRLTSCMVDRYATRTGLVFRPNTTNDMTYYHAFDEINTETTAAIIETGFLNLDQQILTQKPDLVAQGIVDGLLCFIRNESVTPTQTTP
ncbi:MAG: N-acetylmuramoyl-L-alanine amidase [Chloroflexi bacterium]|nr:MAG: N-acetylmuramoyl-L-alanine amidase [Chloroflexota bacterium]